MERLLKVIGASNFEEAQSRLTYAGAATTVAFLGAALFADARVTDLSPLWQQGVREFAWLSTIASPLLTIVTYMLAENHFAHQFRSGSAGAGAGAVPDSVESVPWRAGGGASAPSGGNWWEAKEPGEQLEGLVAQHSSLEVLATTVVREQLATVMEQCRTMREAGEKAVLPAGEVHAFVEAYCDILNPRGGATPATWWEATTPAAQRRNLKEDRPDLAGPLDKVRLDELPTVMRTLRETRDGGSLKASAVDDADERHGALYLKFRSGPPADGGAGA